VKEADQSKKGRLTDKMIQLFVVMTQINKLRRSSSEVSLNLFILVKSPS
jgi:hypothetical protein